MSSQKHKQGCQSGSLYLTPYVSYSLCMSIVKEQPPPCQTLTICHTMNGNPQFL